MSADGVALSLDEYIKVQKKNGAFKPRVGRGGKILGGGKGKVLGGNKKAKAAGAVAGRNAIGGARRKGRRQQRQKTVGRQRGGGGRNSRYFNNTNNMQHAVALQLARGGLEFVGLRRKNKNRYNNIRNRGQVQSLMALDRRVLVQRKQRNRNNRVNNLAISGETRFLDRNFDRAGGRRMALKFAQKRIQKARVQLSKQRRAVVRPLFFQSRFMGRQQAFRSHASSISSGVRMTRSGFVTVSNPVEKQLQRLVVKEKIQKARSIRLNRNFQYGSRGLQNNAVEHSRFPQQEQEHLQSPKYPVRRARQSNVHFNDRRVSLNQYEREIPDIGRSMYADREQEPPRSTWNPLQPIRRIAVNNLYDPTNPTIEDTYGGLNPDIQRKISFIQNHSQAAANRGEQPRIMPDFRAPTISSNMKLGDRFRMYMH